jgi:hypothetical protein
MMQVAQNDIRVLNLDEARVLDHRHAIVRDIQGVLRVVSLLGERPNELRPRSPHSNVSYTFDRFGTGTQRSYNQQQLEAVHRIYCKPPTRIEYARLLGFVKTEARKPLMVETGDLMGMPYLDNTRLDPNQGGWIIATVTPQGLLFGSTPKVHKDEDSANAELQRLVHTAPGTEFVMFKAVKTAVTQTVQTRTFAN